MDEPVCDGGGVEDGAQGRREEVQGRRVEAEAAGEVKWEGARGVDLADGDVRRLVFYDACGKSGASVQGFDHGRFRGARLFRGVSGGGDHAYSFGDSAQSPRCRLALFLRGRPCVCVL